MSSTRVMKRLLVVSSIPFQGTNETKDYQIYNNAKATITFGNTDVDFPGQTLNLSWNTNDWQVDSATLNIQASQPYASGADIEVYMNSTLVQEFNWAAFQTGSMSASDDVTNILNNGQNTFSAHYHIAYPALQNQTATLNATLVVVWTYIGPGPAPPPPSGGLFGISLPIGTIITIAAILSIIGISGYFIYKHPDLFKRGARKAGQVTGRVVRTTAEATKQATQAAIVAASA
jgi:hypothetical protein